MRYGVERLFGSSSNSSSIDDDYDYNDDDDGDGVGAGYRQAYNLNQDEPTGRVHGGTAGRKKVLGSTYQLHEKMQEKKRKKEEKGFGI